MKKSQVDLIVGLFMIAGFFAFVYLSLQLGEFSVFSLKDTYTLDATFNDISGLKAGTSVEIAGVEVGKVRSIGLVNDDQARVVMSIRSEVSISEDAIASIRTQGIIGDKYVRILQGGSEEMLQDGQTIYETESALDLEELVSKYIFGNV